MRKLFLLGAIGMCFVTTSQAQQKFNVQNGTKTEFYDDLETAIEKSVSGDTLYLPGIVVNVANDLIIDKRLTIIGAGCDVDSIGGLQTTEIKRDYNYANINFRNGSDGSLLMGCIVGPIQFGHQNEFNEPVQDMSNIIILRNKINGDVSIGVANNNNNATKNISIRENIIAGSINGNYATECFIFNNTLPSYTVQSFKSSYINNNIIVSLYYLESCIVQNNFFYSPYLGGVNNSTFNNNAFVGTITFPSESNNGSNNLTNQEAIKTFVGTNSLYPKQAVIRDTSPCKNAGTDGTDIGIYGGSAPYKAGAVPFNPHIDKATISTQTDKDGNLKVNIQVSAQAE